MCVSFLFYFLAIVCRNSYCSGWAGGGGGGGVSRCFTPSELGGGGGGGQHYDHNM